MSELRPNRILGGPHDEFWDHCQSGELRIQRCARCSGRMWPPVERCEHCGSVDLVWDPVSGQGEMVSWCTFDRRYYQQLPLPWDTILVRLDEGPLFVSNPSGVDRSELSLGMRVKVGFIDCHDDAGEFRLPVFGPDPAAQEPRD